MPTFEELRAALKDRRPPLSPSGPADATLSATILKADLFPGKSGEMVETVRAGLLLLNDDLDPAHNIVQSIETSTGSFWHAIIHRREGDFSNARYWWHRTGTHPVFDEVFDLVLHKVADFPFLDDLRTNQAWDPIAFTNRCQRTTSEEEIARLEEIQAIEMGTLLQWCASRVK
jgi:hypothetical protein